MRTYCASRSGHGDKLRKIWTRGDHLHIRNENLQEEAVQWPYALTQPRLHAPTLFTPEEKCSCWRGA